MIVPKFWAEGRIQERINGRQVTVRRFGWSDASGAEAQLNADERAREALALIVAGKTIARRDLKRAYNGSEGVPIREEIVASHGETVLTRNSYGALCLNTPNVLFADIDLSDQPSSSLIWSILTALHILAVAIGLFRHSWLFGIIGILVALLASYPIAAGLHRVLVLRAGGPEQQATNRLATFLESHPDWNVRLYRTPAGFRILAMHRTFDPGEGAVTEFFQAVGTDPIYVRMCQRQHCFRARVSPKPWRIGIGQHLLPRPGVWPINPGRLPERRRWIAGYEDAARSFASCRFVESLGSRVIHPAAAAVQRIHDELCQAQTTLPLA